MSEFTDAWAAERRIAAALANEVDFLRAGEDLLGTESADAQAATLLMQFLDNCKHRAPFIDNRRLSRQAEELAIALQPRAADLGHLVRAMKQWAEVAANERMWDEAPPGTVLEIALITREE